MKRYLTATAITTQVSFAMIILLQKLKQRNTVNDKKHHFI
uniref:Uncharacterized protein n=1 Tax=Rhizophora mucronata TaxID=61149 RepID=A0A2P2QJM2_RHIMU